MNGVIAQPADLIAWGVERVGGVTEDRAAMVADLEILKPKKSEEYQLDWELRVRGEELESLQNQLVTARALLEKAEHETLAIGRDLETAEGDRDALSRNIADLILGFSSKPLATEKPQSKISRPAGDPEFDSDIFKIEKREYVSPGYPVWVADPAQARLGPRLRFAFRDSSVPETVLETVSRDEANKEQLSKAANDFNFVLSQRAAREASQRKNEAAWLQRETEITRAETDSAETVLAQLFENCEIRRQCWAAERAFFDEMKELIENRVAAEKQFCLIKLKTKENERNRAAADSDKTNTHLKEFQKAEQAAKKRLEILEAEALDFKTGSKRELKTLKDESEKFKIRARKALIQRRQEIGGMTNDVKLLVQRVQRVREGLKKYDVAPGRTLYSDMEALLANLDRLGRQVSNFN